jgi:glycerophosphoryl diester phosphodiesterase
MRFAYALLVIGASTASAQAPTLTRAHAHNDYEHARPLAGALELGFASVEADVYLVNGALLVAHDRDKVAPARTLQSLYLDPLRAWIRQHNGRVFADSQALTLLIDVKSDSVDTYVAIDRVLHDYADILTAFMGDSVVARPVVAIISGNRAISAMRSARVRFAAVDGRLADLSPTASSSPTLIPLISSSFTELTKWKGDGPIPTSLHDELSRITGAAHSHGQRVRFWATPDTPVVWRALFDAGVDVIGADDLEALRTFLVASTHQSPRE